MYINLIMKNYIIFSTYKCHELKAFTAAWSDLLSHCMHLVKRWMDKILKNRNINLFDFFFLQKLLKKTIHLTYHRFLICSNLKYFDLNRRIPVKTSR